MYIVPTIIKKKKCCMGCVPSTSCKLTLHYSHNFVKPWNCFTSLFTSMCSSLLDTLCDNQRENHKLSWSIAVYIYICPLNHNYTLLLTFICFIRSTVILVKWPLFMFKMYTEKVVNWQVWLWIRLLQVETTLNTFTSN